MKLNLNKFYSQDISKMLQLAGRKSFTIIHFVIFKICHEFLTEVPYRKKIKSWDHNLIHTTLKPPNDSRGSQILKVKKNLALQKWCLTFFPPFYSKPSIQSRCKLSFVVLLICSKLNKFLPNCFQNDCGQANYYRLW